MRSLLPLFALVVTLLACSCADSAWMAERSAAKAQGGRTFTTFVLNNRQGMHDNLKYWDEADDLKQAYRHATPSEQRILQSRYNRVQRDWAAADARDAQRSRAWAAATENYQSPASSTYRPRQSTSTDSSQQKIDKMWFDDHMRRTQSGQSYNPHNPYSR